MDKEPKDENEMLPVDQQKIRGKIKHVFLVIPALDERWLCDKKFPYYVFPPRKLHNGSYVAGAKEMWISSMSQVLDDIWWICELPYHKFWSQLIYDKNTLNGVNSFLHLAPLQKLYHKTDDTDILAIYKRIKKAVFQFLKRISRLKESELHFLSEIKYRELMSETSLMPVSRLFCICTIYGKHYEDQTRNIVENAFHYNKNLKLDRVVQRTIQLFTYLKKRLKSAYRELKQNLYHSKGDDDIHAAGDAYRKCVVATCQYLTNIFINMSNFLVIYKRSSENFLDRDFDFHIIRVYKKLLIPLYQEVDIFFNDFCHTLTYTWLTSMLDMTKSEMMQTFNICLLTTLELLSNTRTARDVIQRYIKLMKFSLKIGEFLQDLSIYANVVEIMDKIKKQCPGNVDLSEVNRISQSVLDVLNSTESEDTSLCELPHTESNSMTLHDTLEYIKESYDRKYDEELDRSDVDSLGDDLSSNYSDWSKNEGSDSEYECYLADSDDEKIPTESDAIAQSSEMNSSIHDVPSVSTQETDSTMSHVQLQSAIHHVKDLLPHLEDEFIAMCLKEYKMDVTPVINAIFEDTLPIKLKNINFGPSTVSNHDSKEPVRSKREQTANNSLKEFKRVEYTSYAEMYNDKQQMAEARRIYEQYRNVEEDELYNDDVDDSFEFGIAAQEVDTEVVYDAFKDMPLVNYNHRFAMDDEEDELDDRRDEHDSRNDDVGWKTRENNGIKPLDFCENPEVVRARREHQREVKEQNRHRTMTFSSKGYRTKRFDQRKEDKPANSKNNYRSRDDDNRRLETNNSSEYVDTNCTRIQPRNENKSKEESNRDYKNRIKKWIQNNSDGNSSENATISRKSVRQGDDEESSSADSRPKRFENVRNYGAGSRNDRRPTEVRNKFEERVANTNRKQENDSEPFRNGRVENNDANDDRRPNESCDNTSRQWHLKNVRKSSTANHNRKYLSDRKRRF